MSVRACVRACVRVCVRVCLCLCLCVCVCVCGVGGLYEQMGVIWQMAFMCLNTNPKQEVIGLIIKPVHQIADVSEACSV